MIEIVRSELARFYPGAKSSPVQETFLDRAITEVAAGMEENRRFVDVWTDLFIIFSDDRAFEATRAIFKRFGKNIPERYQDK